MRLKSSFYHNVLNQQLYEALKVSLAQAEALDYLEFHPEGGEQSATLLGLKAEHLLSGEHQKKSIHQVSFISVCFSLFSLIFVGGSITLSNSNTNIIFVSLI